MNEFKVKLGPVREVASENSRISGELSRIRDELYSVRNNLRFKIAHRERIEKRLTQQGEALEEEQKKMDRLSSGLTEIANLYERTESALCGLELPEVEGNSQEMGLPQGIGLVLPWLLAVPWGGGKVFPDTFPGLDDIRKKTASGLVSHYIKDRLNKDQDIKDVKDKYNNWIKGHKKDIPKVKKTYDKNTKTWTGVDLDDEDAVKKFDEEHKNKKLSTAVKIVSAKWSTSKSALNISGTAGNKEGSHVSGELALMKGEAYAEAYGGLFQSDPVTGETSLRPGFGVSAGASFSAFTASEEAQLGTDMLGVYAKSTQTVGRVGAKGEASVGLCDGDGNFDPKIYGELRAEAIAGEITGAVGGKVLGTDVGVKGSLNYGLGAHASAGFKDGKFSLDIGATVGVGGSVSLEVDVSGTVNALCDGAKAAWDGFLGLFD